MQNTFFSRRIAACLLLSVMLVIGCAGKTKSAKHPAPGTPRIEFSELTHDFGKASQNQSLKHSFSFKNTGTGVLIIDKVRSSCGCTAALASGKEIQPGQSGTIDVTFNTGSRQGRNDKTITVTTNDPMQQNVTLKISADIEVLLSVNPQQLVFGKIQKGETPVRYASIIGNDKDTAKIISAESSHKSIQVAVNPSGFENDPEKKIKVAVLPGIKPGRFHERITITTDHPTIKTLVLSVAGDVIGNIMVNPQMLSFGVVQQGKQAERSINLKATGSHSFKVLKAETGHPAINATVEKVTQGMEYNVKVSIDHSKAVPGTILRGKLLITTTDKDQGTIEIPYWGRIEQQPQSK
ncbi:MAG: DUF1573 domain-containing protein [Desulfobacterota bacterium]|nr:DUF1573 domain-containing protein [Thermodesulfobacteriota bacterium]